MSQIHEKSPKHCAQKQAAAAALKKSKKLLLFYLLPSLLFLITTLIMLLLVCLLLIFHPSKPQFSFQQSHLLMNRSITARSSNSSSSIHLTLLSHNPNKRIVGIYYDKFLLHASFKGHNITPNTPIAPFYQGHQETSLLSAVLLLDGRQQPTVAPYSAYQLLQRDDQHKINTAGKTVLISFKVRGRLRWKVGSWVSGKHRFSVNCVAVKTTLATTRLPHPSPSSSKQATDHQCSTSI